MRILIVSILMWLVASIGFSTVVNQVGTNANWASTWTSLGGYDAHNAGVTESMDFVGDANNPGLYYANNGSYVMFRMRVDISPYELEYGTHALLIDVANYGVTGIDYAFAWDSKSGNNANHGLEMCVGMTNGPTWGQSRVHDIDNSDGAKLVNDINGSGRSTDGYVRTTDNQSTVNFDTTTFIDFAVSWQYLETYTNLRSNQTWCVQVASIVEKTDHNAFNGDVGGGANLSDNISVGWSAPIAIPEPATAFLLALGGGLVWLIRFKQRH